MVLAVRFNAEPTQSGLFEETVGAVGSVLMTTVVVPAKLVQLPTFAVTL